MVQYDKNNITYGETHVHTEHSFKDSPMSISKLIDALKKKNCPACAITDHGTLLGVFSFMQACKDAGIKGIPGVEAYMQEDGGLVEGADAEDAKKHLVLLAKDADGYFKGISKAVTDSNRRQLKDVPRMNMDILKKWFGPGSAAHGHVIATSACVGGILASILLQNSKIDKEAEKARKWRDRYESPESPSYKKNVSKYEELEKREADLVSEKETVNAIASKNYGAKKRALKAYEGKSEYASVVDALEKEMAESEKAKEELAVIKKNLAQTRKIMTVVRGKIKDAKESHEKWNKYNDEIEKLLNSKKSEEELIDLVKATINEYLEIFGEGNFFIELQYHGIDKEAYAMPILANIADEMGLPTIAANDVHFAENTEDDIRARQLIRSLRFNKFEPMQTGDDQYYFKSDYEQASALMEMLSEEQVEKAMMGKKLLIDSCNVEFKKENHEPRFINEDSSETSAERLRRLANEGIKTKYGKNWTEEHQKRLEYELDVIESLKYTDYLCIVADFIQEARRLGMVGPGRGSAVGSIVCYLTDITQVDPIPYHLLFERFLNKDRVSSPDIDTDFDIVVREKMIEYVKNKYGKDAVCNIATIGTLAAKNSIRNAARILGSELHNDPKYFLNLGDAIAKEVSSEPKTKLSDTDFSKFKSDKDAQQILKNARLIEGVAVQSGMHAAGVIISDNNDVSDYVPLMWDDDNQKWLCQCDMTQAESDAGLLKMDFLGLKNLNVIADTLAIIKKYHGEDIDIVAVGQGLSYDGKTTKYDKKGKNVFEDIFSKGQTNAVFQFESNGMKSMLKRFKPNNIEDLILLVACFRPGPIQYLDDIIDVKHGRKKPHYIVPQMEEILGATYGYPVYQEQIMQIFNKIAGFTLGESDIIRRYMSKKKTEKFAAYKDKFIEGLLHSGAKKKDAEDFWQQLLDFSKYAFNKSHATAYAFVAFYTAWLKLYYPAEYMTAVLNYTPVDKLQKMVAECKNIGIEVLPPDINDSEREFSYKDDSILFGFKKIKGVASAADWIIERRKEKPFEGFKDYINRGQTKKNVTEALIKAGAMDRWSPNRTALLVSIEEISKYDKKIKEKEELIKSSTDEKQIAKAMIALDGFRDQLDGCLIPIGIYEDKEERLRNEFDLLGMYVSGHPLDAYKDIVKKRSCPVSEAYVGEVILCGMISNLRLKKRKKDGKSMAFFDLEDESGTMKVCVFTDTYASCGSLIHEGNVVSINGECKIDNRSISDEDDEEALNLIAKNIHSISKSVETLILSVKDVCYWTEYIYPLILQYEGEDFKIQLYDELLSEIRNTKLKVGRNILTNPIISAMVVDIDHIPGFKKH